MDVLRESVFANKFQQDDTEPLFYLAEGVGVTGSIVLLPNFLFQLLLISTVGIFTGMAVAVVVYYFIVKQQGTMQSFLVGYGILAPLLFYFPFFITQSFQLRNTVLVMLLAGASAVWLPRLGEAMHSQVPKFAANNLSLFILYFGFTLQINFDHKANDSIMRATVPELGKKTTKAIFFFLGASAILSVLTYHDHAVFPKREPRMLADYMYWGNILNTTLYIVLMSLVIDLALTTLGIITSLLTGVSFIDPNNFPLMLSTSPSDFWGHRWNRFVSLSLRRGVYRPLRSFGVNRSVASIATFLTSGLLHEYMLMVLACRGGAVNNPMQTPYQHQLGNQFIFFVWNAVILFTEQLFIKTPALQWMKHNLPNPVKTFIVLLAMVPLAHYFTDEYLNSGVFNDISMTFPRIVFKEI